MKIAAIKVSLSIERPYRTKKCISPSLMHARFQGSRKVADMSVNGGGSTPFPQLSRMFWNIKICTRKDFKLSVIFSLQFICFQPFWVYWYTIYIPNNYKINPKKGVRYVVMNDSTTIRFFSLNDLDMYIFLSICC